jgi:spermidine export protein MdtJ
MSDKETQNSLSIPFAWLFLLGSIVFEVVGTSIMKLSQEGWPLLGMLTMYLLLGLSYFCLAKAVLRIPLGVAYAFWEGLGLLLITFISFVVLKERLDALRVSALLLILVGTLLVHQGTEPGDISGTPADRSPS